MIPLRATPLFCLLILGSFGRQTLAQDSRVSAVGLEDVLRCEQSIRSSSFSPDGTAVAFSIAPPIDYTQSRHGGVWIQEDRREAKFVTGGMDAGSGWLVGPWSPDSRRIILRSLGSGDSKLWVYDRDRSQATVVSQDGYLIAAQWIGENTLICQVSPNFRIMRNQDYLPEQWKRFNGGTIASVSVLQSGGNKMEPMNEIELRLVDLVTTNQTRIAGGHIYAWSLSPDRAKVAFAAILEKKSFQFTQAKDFPTAKGVYAEGMPDFAQYVSLVEIREASTGRVIARKTQSGRAERLSWAPDSRSVAYTSGQHAHAPSLHLVRTEEGKEKDFCDFSPLGADCVWLSPQTFLAYGGASSGALPSWHQFDIIGEKRVAESAMTSLPRDLSQLSDGRILGVIENQLFEFASHAGGIEAKLVYSGNDSIRIVRLPGTELGRLVLASRDNIGTTEYFLFDADTKQARPLAKPTREAVLKSFSFQSSHALFADESGGYCSDLWRVDGNGVASRVLTVNSYLWGKAEPIETLIAYKIDDDKAATALLLTPRDGQNKRKYPLVTVVYPGTIVGSGAIVPPKNRWSWLDVRILIARGFAVLIPSIPLREDGADDPYLRVREGVMPALDAAIVGGNVDSKRLFVMGHSYGGFAAFSLATHTDRFKAALAANGLANLVSDYTSLTQRYHDFPEHELHYSLGMHEYGLIRMGSSLWEDPERYRRNSPIHFFNKVTCPLLIVHSDDDLAVPMQQSEEAFRALQRLGKRTDFARYWGDQHSLTSPANIRDFWSRVIAWFDEYGDMQRDAAGNFVWSDDEVASRKAIP